MTRHVIIWITFFVLVALAFGLRWAFDAEDFDVIALGIACMAMAQHAVSEGAT